MDPNIASHPSNPGLQITDPIENGRFEATTPLPVTPTPTSPDRLSPAPVATAATIETAALELPTVVILYIRHASDFEQVATTAGYKEPCLPSNDYLIELSNTPMKLYLRVDSSLNISYQTASVRLSFDGPTEVVVGARSFHDQPAGTITTPDTPRDVMQAISLLGSGLEDTSPERSFPTLRGHPPRIEHGPDFSVPDGLARPETGVELVLPLDYDYLYPATSLAYYLGANVVPGDDPRLTTDDGFEYPLETPVGYEETVSRVLRQVFFLDCVTRTEGLYDVPLYERQQVEPVVDLDFPRLYQQSVSEQLEAYLSIPYSVVEEYLPAWPLTMDIMPTPDNLSMLSWAASELAVVRTPQTRTPTATDTDPVSFEPVNDFRRGAVSGTGPGVTDGVLTRSATLEDISETEIITPRETESLEYAWVGDGYPLGANKATQDAWSRRVDRPAPEQTSITVHVVCNDTRMADEGVVEEYYRQRDLPAVNATISEMLSVSELQAVIESDVDFLHFIGHVDAAGMRCPDGHLDARDLDRGDVGVRAFFLNACRSFAQGQALVECGSAAGVVTLAELPNKRGTRVGQALARMLNCGFPLQWAVQFVQQHVSGYSYITVGDGRITLVQGKSGAPIFAGVTAVDEGWELALHTVTAAHYEVGTMFSPSVNEEPTQYLCSGLVDTFHVSDTELDEYFGKETFPVLHASELVWSDEVSAADLRGER